MAKLCDVVRHTPFFTVVKYDDVEIQFPLIKTMPEKVYVEYADGFYKICEKKPKLSKRVKTEKVEDTVLYSEGQNLSD